MKTLLTAAAFVLLATTAQAGSKATLPKDFHGSWCVSQDGEKTDLTQTTYRRGKCEGALNVTARGFGYGGVQTCQLLTATPTNHYYAFRAKFKCRDGDASPYFHYWIGFYDDDILFMREANSTFTGPPK